jgi:glycosyltransferase involved in cell wall biosynthesis
MRNISILILTKNEQHDLLACLESVAWSDDIHVYDSMSIDNTVEIAKNFGALVTQRDYGDNKLAFGGDEAVHRNWGLQNISFKYNWVFVIDADERVTPDLMDAMSEAVLKPNGCVAFRIQRRDFFLGKWLKHVQTTPFYVRLFRPEMVHYSRAINCTQVVNGDIEFVAGYLDHFPFSKGMNHWIDRHNGYSRFEAQQIIDNRKDQVPFSAVKAFIEKDFNERRFHQKELFYRLPFRPLIKFLILYIGKRGFLDSRAGFTYAMLQSIYEYFIVLKTRELNAQSSKDKESGTNQD